MTNLNQERAVHSSKENNIDTRIAEADVLDDRSVTKNLEIFQVRPNSISYIMLRKKKL